MHGFEENGQKPYFWAKMAKNLIFGQKWPLFGPKKGPKQAKKKLSEFQISLSINKP